MRVQGVPSPKELIVGKGDMKDAIAETIDSPTTLITHRYPDRVLFVTTDMCSMYCRFCTRRRIVGGTEAAVSDQDYENAFTYIRRNQDVRDVLISGGDPLTLSDEKLEWLAAEHHGHRSRRDRAPRHAHARRPSRSGSRRNW